MAKKTEIIVEIDEKGEVTAEVVGGDGASCLAELGKLMAGVGVMTDVNKKKEFFKKDVRVERVDLKG